jgi:type VI secretion system protein VasD
MSSSRVPLVCVGFIAILALSGCASHRERVAARTVLVASNDANPDIGGRPSPIVVRVFQLRGAAEFANADFFALYGSEKEALGASLVQREEYVMRPGQRLETQMELAPETRYIGAIAAFRDVNGARWRALQPRPARPLFSKRQVSIGIDREALTVSVKK